MGWLARKQAEGAALVEAAVAPHTGGEPLLGCVHAMQQSTMSAQNYAVGVTPNHLLIVELDRKARPTGTPAVRLQPEEIEVSNIFLEGATWNVGRKSYEIRFSARGVDYELATLGGNMLENSLAGDDQLRGLDAFADFLRRCNTN